MQKSFRVSLGALAVLAASLVLGHSAEAQNQLTLTINPATVAEGSTVTGYVSCHPAPPTALVVSLLSTDTSEARVPATVTIPAGQVSAAFTVTGVVDNIVDGTRLARIVASAPGFITARMVVEVTDTSVPRLIVRIASKGHVIGEATRGTVTGIVERNTVAPDLIKVPLTVNLVSTNPNEATVPATVTIPAGQVKVEFPISNVIDDVNHGVQRFEITATAPGFNEARASLVARDSAKPTLVLLASVMAFNDTNGATASTGTVTRNTPTTGALIVKLASNDTSLARVPATVTIPAGAASATFPISAVANPALKGKTKTVGITATAADFVSGLIKLTVTH